MIFLCSPVNSINLLLLCEVLLKISQALKFYPVKIMFTFSIFATWVPVFTEHVRPTHNYNFMIQIVTKLKCNTINALVST